MENTIKLLFIAVLTVMIIPAEAKEDLEMIVREMKIEMGEVKKRLTKNEEDLKAKDVSIQDLEREVSFLKDPPWTFACGAHYDLISIKDQAISYATLLYSSSNVAGAGLDISTGVFTAGHPGSYTATWSLMASSGQGSLEVFLRKNGKIIQESCHHSFVTDQGGRTLVLHLDRGDTMDLWCKNCHSWDTTFCVSLSQADVE